jgi:hypothetical protein
MLTTKARKGRQITAAAALAGAALLVTACSSSASSSAAGSSAGSAPPSATSVTSAGSPSAPGSAPVSAPASTPSPASAPASPSGASTFLAEGQDINGTALHEPACDAGCALSGDSTAILVKMTWTTWSATEAVGTGTYKLDDCNPNCAAATPVNVAMVMTLSQPVKVCSSSGTRWFWSRASFKFPNGLPKALQGDNAPQNPWNFSTLVTAAQQSCAT